MDYDENSEDESMSYSNDIEKLYESPLSVINALKPVFNQVHPTQLVFQLCNKIKEPCPVYTYSEDDNYKFKCTANMNMGSLCVTGYNDQKKEAKKISSEMVVLDMIKNKKYRSKTIQVLVKDYNVNPQVFEFKRRKKRRNEEEMMKDIEGANSDKPLLKIDNFNSSFDKEGKSDLNKVITRKREREDTGDVLLEILKEEKKKKEEALLIEKDNKEKLKQEIKEIPPVKESQIGAEKPNTMSCIPQSSSPINPFLLSAKEIKPEFPMEFKTEKIQSTLLNFELFCLKWERTLLLDKETILALSKFTQNISLTILKLKLRMSIQDSYAIGSYSSSSLRLNRLIVDYLIILNHKQPSQPHNGSFLPENTLEDFIEHSNSDLTKLDYRIDIKKEADKCYLEISNKADLKCKVHFLLTENAKQSTDHIDYLSKKSFSIEQEIALKLIKAWRRSKGLLFLNPIIIEFIILNITYPLANQIVISFFLYVTDLEEDFFIEEYQKDSISSLKLSTKYPKVVEEAKMALEAIKANNFSDLF